MNYFDDSSTLTRWSHDPTRSKHKPNQNSLTLVPLTPRKHARWANPRLSAVDFFPSICGSRHTTTVWRVKKKHNVGKQKERSNEKLFIRFHTACDLLFQETFRSKATEFSSRGWVRGKVYRAHVGWMEIFIPRRRPINNPLASRISWKKKKARKKSSQTKVLHWSAMPWALRGLFWSSNLLRISRRENSRGGWRSPPKTDVHG